MDFSLSEDQKLVKEMVREFAEKELTDVAVAIDETREFPFESIKKMAQLGLMGMTIPEEYGGTEMDFRSIAIAIEEISRVCASIGVTTAVHNSLTAYSINEFGTPAQKKKYLPDLAKGKKIGAFALTEPGAGSDVSGMESTAILKQDHYVLNGRKRFITNGEIAEVIIVFAYTDKEKKHKGMSCFIVENGFSGFSVGKHENLMGMRATANTEIVMEDCIVPKDNLLGEENNGFKTAMKLLDVSRIDIGAQAVGIAQAAFEEAIKYSKERTQFGRKISEFQLIQAMLADMATKIEAARLLVYQSADMKDRGVARFSLQSSIAKYYASTIAVDCARMAMQILGGIGYTKDYSVERFYRDAKVLEIYEGTSEIQKIVIAKSLLK